MNLVWGGLLLAGLCITLLSALAGDSEALQRSVDATFDMARLSVDISIGLVGLLALWSGLFKVAESAGLIHWLSRGLNPLFRRIMPEVPEGHSAQGAVTMNLAANMLGLDNAATPLGLKAMQLLQELNPVKDCASNAQILFLVLNTSSVTLLPVTIFMYRAQLGAAHPADVFLPILIATSASTFVGLLTVMWLQKIPLDRVVCGYLLGFVLLLTSLLLWLSGLSQADIARISMLVAHAVMLLVIGGFIAAGLVRKVPVYDVFIEGAKTGFQTAVMLIPYLVAMLVAIGVFRASGALTWLVDTVKPLVVNLGFDPGFVDALPVALMKPFSGSGSRAMMLDVMNAHGVDSLAGKIAAVMQGSTETTFYVLTLYFGVVGITRLRYAMWCGLLCDLVGALTAIAIGVWFFT